MERKRLTATGATKWTCHNVGRILQNATYKGYIGYNKSYSNNYLEQKRIHNLDRDTYFTAAVVAFSLATGVPFGVLDMSVSVSAADISINASTFNYSVDSSGTGWNYDVSTGYLTISSGNTLSIENGPFNAGVSNNGTIIGGEFGKAVSNDGNGIIQGGTFNVDVTNGGTITGGTFNGKVTNNNIISGGTFNGEVTNSATCEITGGVFTNTVNNMPKSDIQGGTFYGTVNNKSTVSGDNIVNGLISSGSTFKSGSTINNSGRIQGGSFESGSTINNSGEIAINIPNGVTVNCQGGHTVGTAATCQTQAICKLCGLSYGSTAPHNFDTDGKCLVCHTEATIEYTHSGSTYYSDDFDVAIAAINSNGGTITLRGNVTTSNDITVTRNLKLDLGTYTLDLGDKKLSFEGIEASIIGTGTIKSTYTSSGTGEAVYVVNGARLTIGESNGNGPTITGDANAITTANSDANKLIIYSGTFNGACHFDSDTTSEYNILIKSGSFNDEVYADWTQIDGGVFMENINCVSGSHLIVNDCECEKSLKIGQGNNATKYVTLNGGIFKGGIENQTDYGKTTDYLGIDRYFIDENGQIITISDSDDLGYDIMQYVTISPLYTVTFETNDFGGEDIEKKVAKGYAVEEPAAMTDPEAAFAGWYKDSALTTEWDFVNDKITGDTTIYAKWNPYEQVAAPVFAPVSGTSFSNELSVTITSATDGAEIYYTTDGTAPTSSAARYTGTIKLTDSTIIKAIAVKAGMRDSEASSASYTKSIAVTTPDVTTAPTVIAPPSTMAPTIIVTPTVTTTEPITTTTTAITTTKPITTTEPITTEPSENDDLPVNDDPNPGTGVMLCFGGVPASAMAVIAAGKKKNK